MAESAASTGRKTVHLDLWEDQAEVFDAERRKEGLSRAGLADQLFREALAARGVTYPPKYGREAGVKG